MSVPHCQPGRWPEQIGASRFASRIRRDSPEGCRLALLGMPDDTGVGLNGGRLGAAEGPTALRRALARYGAAEASGIEWPGVFDAGDVEPADELDETHDRVSVAVDALLAADLFPIGIGGGHDLTYAFVRPLATRLPGMVGVYFDAHLDVREQKGSGMPFRRLVEDCSVRELHVLGLDRFANSAEHVRWFQGHGGRIDSLEPTDPLPAGDLFVSLDLDVIDQAHAPGVSAMNPSGWSPERAEAWVRAAGRSTRVRCFDIMELSPPHDENGRTSRLAARLLLAFLEAFTERGS